MAIKDTSQERQDHWLFGGSPGAIERQEAEGQRELVQSQQLPARTMGSAREELEALGVRFIGPSDGDPLFMDVELPPGWRKVTTNHPLWSDLVDADGTVIARIFYKAAFYDRKAHISMARPDDDGA